MSDGPRIAVVTFPGSNDDGDAALALEFLGADAVRVWHADPALPDGTEGVVLPGGFSYGDYLRCGAIARFAPVMESVSAFAARRPGARHLQRLPDPLRGGAAAGRAAPQPPAAVPLRRRDGDGREHVERLRRRLVGRRELVIPIKHGEGNWYGDADLLASLEADGQIAFRYTEDVNGALDRIAGVTNEAGNVLGLMPHPEHAVDPLLGPTGGAAVLEGLIAAARARTTARV